MLRLTFFGSPQIELDGQPVTTDRRTAVALLAYLVLTGRPHSRDFLATLLWPDLDSARSLAYLRRTVWELNNSLGKGWLEVDRNQVAFADRTDMWLDVSEFRRLADQGDQGSLERAVKLCQGDFLAGFTLPNSPAFDEWQYFESEDIQRCLLRTLDKLVARFEEQGDWPRAAIYAERRLSRDTLDESAYRQLMRILIRMGKRSAAIELYQQCVQILDQELGLSPQPETVSLYDQIVGGRWHSAEDLSIPTGKHEPYTSLPAWPTAFIGRQKEVAAVTALLTSTEHRLLNLVGPGGVGKTRLAIQAASTIRQDYPGLRNDGVCFVTLAPLSDSEAIVGAVANRLSFNFYRNGENPRQQLLDFLRHKKLLLVLDNFEHLIDDVSLGLLVDIIAECPSVQLMTTSRSRLYIRGEQLYLVEGMKVPEMTNLEAGLSPTEYEKRFSAIGLFADCARRVDPDFQLSVENLPAITRVCHQVDGLPLGIELAAGWVDLLSPFEISLEIERSLDFLASEQHDIPDRQRSIRAVFDSSWSLLSDEEQELFCRLTVIRGSFTRAAAEQIGRASLRTLHALVNKSWLHQGGDGRYVLHELLRQFGQERLLKDEQDWQDTFNRHASYFAAFVQEQSLAMRGPRQKVAFEAMSVELENIRASWLWLAGEGDLSTISHQMTAGLIFYIVHRSSRLDFQSTFDFTREAWIGLENEPALRSAWAIWLIFEATYRQYRSHWVSDETSALVNAYELCRDFDAIAEIGYWYVELLRGLAWNVDRIEGLDALRQSVEELGRRRETWLRATAALYLAEVLVNGEFWHEAKPYLEEARTLYKMLGDQMQMANTFMASARYGWSTGEYQEATELAEKAMAIYQALGNLFGLSHGYYQLAELSFKQGLYERGFGYLEQRLDIYQELGHRAGIIDSYHWISLHAARYSDLDYAFQARFTAISLAEELGDQALLAWNRWELGELYRLEGDMGQARQTLDQARELFAKLDDAMGIAFCHRLSADLALAAGQDTEAINGYEEYLSWARMSYNAWSVSFALARLGWIAWLHRHYGDAWQRSREALKFAWDTRNRDLCMPALFNIALLLSAENRHQEGVALATFVRDHFLTWHEIKSKAVVWLKQSGNEPSLGPSSESGFSGNDRELEAVVQKFVTINDPMSSLVE